MGKQLSRQRCHTWDTAKWRNSIHRHSPKGRDDDLLAFFDNFLRWQLVQGADVFGRGAEHVGDGLDGVAALHAVGDDAVWGLRCVVTGAIGGGDEDGTLTRTCLLGVVGYISAVITFCGIPKDGWLAEELRQKNEAAVLPASPPGLTILGPSASATH